jgi:hypothetical protein
MSDSPQISSLETFHNAYNIFIFTVNVLSKSPEEQCEIMGDYNTAWELKDDALAGRYLIGSGLFTDQQESAVLAYLVALESIPVNNMPGGSGHSLNLLAMQHPTWKSVRLLSKNLLATLASVTEANQELFGCKTNEP